MTPEERARIILRLDGFAEMPETFIAAAIRSAENDALERAALALEAKIDSDAEIEEISVSGSLIEAAETVRTLKHKSAP